MRVERLQHRRRPGRRGRARARAGARRRVGRGRGARDRRGRARRAATRSSPSWSQRFDGGAGEPAARRASTELEAALAALDPAVRAGLEVAIANVRTVAEAGVSDGDRGHPAAGPARLRARDAGAPGGDLRPRRPGAVPEHGRDGRRHGARRGGRGGRGLRALRRPRDPRRVRAVRRRRGVAHGRRARGRRARLRHRDDRARRRDRRARATCTCRRPSAWCPARSGSTGSRAPATCWSSPTRARTRAVVAADLLAQAEHGPGTIVAAVSRPPAAARRGGRACWSPTARPSRRSSRPLASAPRLDFANAFAPEHLRADRPVLGAPGRRRAQRGLRVRRRRRRRRVRRLRRRLQPHPADRRRRAVRLRPVARGTSAGA